MKPTILILFLLWTTSAYPSDEPSTQEDLKTKATEVEQDQKESDAVQNPEQTEGESNQEAIDKLEAGREAMIPDTENPDKTEDERKQDVADEVTKGDPGAIDDLWNSSHSVYCTPDEGKRVLIGSYIDQEAAANAVEAQPDPTICYVE